MPALPFFSALAPAPVTAQSTPSQSSSPLMQQAMTEPEVQGPVMTEAMQSDQEPSFLQQFQLATQGQELAANLPALSAQPINTEIETELSDELIEPLVPGMESVIQSDMQEQAADPMLSPWSQYQPVEHASGDKVVNETATAQKSTPVIAMSDLEKQRQAAPQYQANTGESVNSQVLQARDVNYQTMNVMHNTQEQNTAANVSSPLAAMNPALQKVATTQTLDQPIEDVSEAESGMDLSSLEMDTELMDENIHEKPITLQVKDTVLKPVTSAAVETLAAQQSDGPESPQLSQAQQNNRSAALTENLQTKQAEASTEKTNTQFKIDVPPQNPQWNDQVAKRIGIMASEQLQTARIQLDPPELGALEIKIKVQHDQVSVAFASNHQVVRDALESQAPRLRELLEQQGVELADVNVSEQNQQQGQSQEQGEGDGAAMVADDGSWQEGDEQASLVEIESDSLVDYFA